MYSFLMRVTRCSLLVIGYWMPVTDKKSFLEYGIYPAPDAGPEQLKIVFFNPAPSNE